MESVSVGTIDIHKIVKEDLNSISPDEAFDEWKVLGPHLDGVLKSAESISCYLNCSILSRSTASIEYGTDIEL